MKAGWYLQSCRSSFWRFSQARQLLRRLNQRPRLRFQIQLTSFRGSCACQIPFFHFLGFSLYPSPAVH